jgi:hypothetical protein
MAAEMAADVEVAMVGTDSTQGTDIVTESRIQCLKLPPEHRRSRRNYRSTHLGIVRASKKDGKATQQEQDVALQALRRRRHATNHRNCRPAPAGPTEGAEVGWLGHGCRARPCADVLPDFRTNAASMGACTTREQSESACPFTSTHPLAFLWAAEIAHRKPCLGRSLQNRFGSGAGQTAMQISDFMLEIRDTRTRFCRSGLSGRRAPHSRRRPGRRPQATHPPHTAHHTLTTIKKS